MTCGFGTGWVWLWLLDVAAGLFLEGCVASYQEAGVSSLQEEDDG